jgi:UDP-N-acetylmuramoyl-tripeptide--D-alanyl-D-alanine ligase
MKNIFKKIVLYIVTLEARLVIKKYKPHVIAVTGNIGKTSTKDAVFSVLREDVSVRASQKSFNSDFGVPLTILGESTGWSNFFAWFSIIARGAELVLFTEDYPSVLVLEVGADAPGDIKKIASWLHPDTTIITQFQEVPVHIEFFKNREELIAEKGYLVKATKKDGTVLYTADDHDSHELAKKSHASLVGYGFHGGVQVRAEGTHILYQEKTEKDLPVGMITKIICDDEVATLKLPGVLGEAPVYASLPAFYIAKRFGIPLGRAAQLLEATTKTKGRMRLLRGIKNTTIIDDTYNSSPKAVIHALKNLEKVQTTGKKIAVLGDMLDLGKFTTDEHYKIGKDVHTHCHLLFLVGKRSLEIGEGARDAGMKEENIFHYDSSSLVSEDLKNLLEEEDVILVKGSQSMRMEKVVADLIENPEEAPLLLVRQEKEWLQK